MVLACLLSRKWLRFSYMAALVAGVGNELKCDDAFGVLAAARMKADPRMTADIVVQEVGIGGIHMVQELMRGYDALLLFDAFDRGGDIGQLWLLEPELPDVDSFTEKEKRDFFADVHYATPVRAMTMARAVGALPPLVRIIGCQPSDADAFGTELHTDVEDAIPRAVNMAFDLLASLR